jgi:hypothetical protein
MSPETLTMLLSFAGVIAGMFLRHYAPNLWNALRAPAPPPIVIGGQQTPQSSAPTVNPAALDQLLDQADPQLGKTIEGLAAALRQRLAERLLTRPKS